MRELARAARLPVAERPESQDLCFLAGTRADEFLRRHGEPADERARSSTSTAARSASTTASTASRSASGAGSASPDAEPLYVIEKDAASGRVTVGPRAALAATNVSVAGAMLHRDARQVDRVKLRYRSEPVRCRIAGDAAPAATARSSSSSRSRCSGSPRARPRASCGATA